MKMNRCVIKTTGIKAVCSSLYQPQLKILEIKSDKISHDQPSYIILDHAALCLCTIKGLSAQPYQKEDP